MGKKIGNSTVSIICFCFRKITLTSLALFCLLLSFYSFVPPFKKKHSEKPDGFQKEEDCCKAICEYDDHNRYSMPCAAAFDRLHIGKNYKSKQIHSLDFVRPSLHVVVRPSNAMQSEYRWTSNCYVNLKQKIWQIGHAAQRQSVALCVRK